MAILARTEAEVVAAVQWARAHKRNVEIAGARTKRHMTYSRYQGPVLDLSRLAGIVEYQPEEMILTVRPGTKVAEIEACLAEHDQQLGFDPPDWGPLLGAPASSGTIGGAVAADVCGPGAVRYGRVRDHLLGFRAVNGYGEAYKGGGKVVKNVTGFDLPKLMCGSFGRFGPLTELTLRVFPKPPRQASLAVHGLEDGEGLRLLRLIHSSPLGATGLAFARGTAWFRFDGTDAALREKLDTARALLSDHEVSDGDDAVFRDIGNGTALDAGARDVWRIHAPPAAAPRIVSALAPARWVADWAGALLWLATDEADAEAMRAAVAREGGRMNLMRAMGKAYLHVRRLHPSPPELAALEKAVKAAFDPLGLFGSMGF